MRLAASTSFSAAEVEVLDSILMGLLRGGDVSRLAKTPEAHNILRKVGAMKNTILRKREARRVAQLT